MAVLVTERRTPIRFSRGNFATRGFDITGVSDAAAAQTALLTDKDIEVGKIHPLDESITVPPDGIEIVQRGMGYQASVQYRGVPGFSAASESLLAQKWRISIDPSSTEEAIDHVHDGFTAEGHPKMRPLVNSSRQPILGITAPFPELTIEMWRYESEYELSKHLEFSNTWNSEPIVLPKLGPAAAGEVLLVHIRPAEEMAADSTVVKVVYKLRARPRLFVGDAIYHGFYKRIHDVGTRVYVSGGTFKPITYKDPAERANGIDSNILLDGHGALHPTMTDSYDASGQASVPGTAPTVLDETDYGVFLLYDPTFGGRDFAGLNIGANL